jgi:8-oxo-dGTP diphosphatase
VPVPPLQVVAAVLRNTAGEVLLAQRPAGKQFAGYWEFPGGKLQSGESAEAALRRELREELGIEVLDSRALLSVQHDYPDRRVELDVWLVVQYAGVPCGLEGQELKWVPPAGLRTERLLPADGPIVELLGRQPDELRLSCETTQESRRD